MLDTETLINKNKTPRIVMRFKFLQEAKVYTVLLHLYVAKAWIKVM